ncbi:MAG: hypothetical protein K1060chlam1_01435 [Candidatus Anoxychlamydiales bacterium]|nr:hypothetical protein [Candidatus Anoxychlamydiales bacterium]
MASSSSYASPARDFAFDRNLKELTQLETKNELLSSEDISRLSDAEIKAFVTNYLTLYPVYEHYGERVFKESSIFWRVLSYIPIIPYFNINISGFESYKKLGEDSVVMNMLKFRDFLPKAISEEIKLLVEKVSKLNVVVDVVRSGL